VQGLQRLRGLGKACTAAAVCCFPSLSLCSLSASLQWHYLNFESTVRTKAAPQMRNFWCLADVVAVLLFSAARHAKSEYASSNFVKC
jgi:hypothetical protein